MICANVQKEALSKYNYPEKPPYPIVMILSVDHDGDTPELEDGGLPMRRKPTEMTAPPSVRFPAVIRPPRSTMARAMARPRPDSPFLPFTNRWNKYGEFLGYAFAIIGNGEEYPAILIPA